MSLTHQGADTKRKKNDNSTSLWKRHYKHRKLDKMRQQRYMFQMKEQDKTSEKQLSEVEIGNLSEKEFTIMITKLIQNFRKVWSQGYRRYEIF